jgi:hypothetical protein
MAGPGGPAGVLHAVAGGTCNGRSGSGAPGTAPGAAAVRCCAAVMPAFLALSPGRHPSHVRCRGCSRWSHCHRGVHGDEHQLGVRAGGRSEHRPAGQGQRRWPPDHSGAFRGTGATPDGEGLDLLLSHRISDPTDDGAGSAVYSSYPLEVVGVLPDTPFRMPTVRLTAFNGATAAVLEVTNVHALPPVDVRVDQWRSDLEAVARLAERPGHRLLIGDFNATYDHSEFRQLLAGGPGSQGLVDVGTASGSRLIPTWPMEGPTLPGITIDHLVTTARIASTGYQVRRVPGADHAAVLAILTIPAS